MAEESEEVWLMLGIGLNEAKRVRVPLVWAHSDRYWTRMSTEDGHVCLALRNTSPVLDTIAIKIDGFTTSHLDVTWFIVERGVSAYVGRPGSLSSTGSYYKTLVQASNKYRAHCREAVAIVAVWWLRRGHCLSALSHVMHHWIWSANLCLV